MQKKHWDLYSNGAMRFYHIKGLSQSKYRIPQFGVADPLKDENREYFKKKWGVMLEKKGEDLGEVFDEPWDGKRPFDMELGV